MPLDQVEDESGEMSFLDHLEELRWHLIRSLIAIFVFAITAFISKGIIFGEIILGPSKPSFGPIKCCVLSELLNSMLFVLVVPFIIQSRQMTGQFSMHITSSFVIGLICAFPYAFWEIWRFISQPL